MPNGIILLDKPQGLTSNGALQRLRKAWRAKSAGHVGTLDPMATGMLPVCLDEATKVIADIESGGKCYEFTLQLGTRTDTGDALGNTVETAAVPELAPATVATALAAFLGVQSQVPPMYSALKRDGRPLYELARKGIEVERAPRRIEIRRLELRALRPDAIEAVCECGKGTYIRTLGEDIALRLGTVGHLTQLRRVWVEPFADRPLVTFDAALAAADSTDAGIVLLPPDAALAALPEASFDDAGATLLRRGQAVPGGAGLASGARIRLYGPGRQFLGIGEAADQGRIQPRRMMAG
jgi:tRNA pseudouridine55 synthase